MAVYQSIIQLNVALMYLKCNPCAQTETMNYESPPLNVSADHICDNVTFANLINCSVLQFLL